jgi:hypothetical protein
MPSRLRLGFRLQRCHFRNIMLAHIDDAFEQLAAKYRTAELVGALTRPVQLP